MAEPSTKDRDPNLLTGETSSPSGVSLEHTNKGRNKAVEKKFNSANGHRKQSKKTTEVSLDNLQDAELQALLDEVVQYRGPRDGEKGTELFQALLKETQESGEESPPAFRATTSTNSSTVQRRRRSRKESNRSFHHPSVTPPTHSTTVAGSNRKGGSLQNISSHHSECLGVRNRRRCDISHNSSSSGSRKREGGSLPCDVARGSLNSSKIDEPCSIEEDNKSTKQQAADDSFIQHCVINMEGVAEVKTMYEVNGHHSEQWRSHTSRQTTNSTDSYEPMEQDLDNNPSEQSCLTKMNTTNSNKSYGTMPSKSLDVDAAIPIACLETSTATQESNRTVILNGSIGEEHLRRTHSRNGDGTTDENGNPFPFSGSRAFSAGSSLASSTSNSTAVLPGSKLQARKNGKKRKDESNIIQSDEVPGFRGDRGVDELLEYIESSENGNKKSMDKKGGSKNVAASKDSSSKVKSREKKSTAKSLLRRTDSNQADSEDSDSGAGEGSSGSPTIKDDAFKSKSDGADELEVVAAADFQTVTKKQRRKKRNSLSNASIGLKSKELLTNASSSPSVMMRPPRQQTGALGSSSASQTGSASSGSAAAGAETAAKKAVASVPPSEPSDLDSDGGDSVHSLPAQPSGPLFAPAPPSSASYADIIRSDQAAPVSFLAESSQPVDIKLASGAGPVMPTAPSDHASTAQAVNVPCNKSSGPKTSSSAPLRRAASLPPTSPCPDAPAVVMMGTSSSVHVDVTFGFDINEELLRLSFQQTTLPGPVKMHLATPPELDSMEVSFSPEPIDSKALTPPASSPESVRSTPTVDFASRYRERPELLNAPLSRRSYEIVDFISQAWKRIERKLDEQHKQPGVGNNGLSLIRVYTLE